MTATTTTPTGTPAPREPQDRTYEQPYRTGYRSAYEPVYQPASQTYRPADQTTAYSSMPPAQTYQPAGAAPFDRSGDAAAAGRATRTAAPDTTRTRSTGSASQYDAGIDQVRYWVGSALTAFVAALIGLIGLVVAHGILHLPVVFGAGDRLDTVSAAGYGLATVAAALAMAALFDAMLHVAPRPLTFFSWVAALLTVLATLMPFATSAGLHSQVALAVTNLAVGLAVLILVPMAAVHARR
jgi:hypothetical protein